MKNYLLIVAVFFSVTLKMAAQPLGWTHSRPVTVTNTTGTYVLNYQLKLTVDTQTPVAAGEMLASGNDIRFGKDCAGTMLLNYWVESGMNTASTVIWVKIDSLPATDMLTLYMFYGNAAAGATSALETVFFGPNSATDSVSNSNPGGVTDSQRGFRFSSDVEILVTAFGKNEPDGTTRYITLFDFASQAILRQQQVGGPAAQYSYGNLASPIWLTAGTQYLLEIHQGATDGYYFGAAPQMGSHLTYYDMRYCNGCSENTFPTNVLGGMHYGYVDMWYFTRTIIASAPIVVVGAAAPVNTTPAPALSVCEGNTTTLTAAGANNLSWYSASTGGSYLGGGSTFSTPVLTAGTATYFVQDSSACAVSPRTAIVVNVNPLPAMSISGAAAICLGDSATLTAGGADTYAWNGGPATDVNTVMPLATTIYTVAGTITATGCVDSVSQTVTVNFATVNISAATLSGIECEGSSDSLIASGGNSYVWSTTETAAGIEVTHTPGSPTTYSVIGTDANGCMDTASVSFSSVSALPSVTVDLTGTDLFCDYSAAATLSGATPVGGVWSGAGVTGNTFDPSAAGVGTFAITYTYTNTDGCAGSGTDSIMVSPCTGISERTNGFSVSVYPNPNNGEFVIVSAADGVYTIINQLGQSIRNITLDASNGRSEKVAGLSNGIYFVTGTSKGESIRKKVVVSR